jgi:hypothetical protein
MVSRPPQDISGPDVELIIAAQRRLGLTARDFYRIELDHRGLVARWAEYDAGGQLVRLRDPEAAAK